MTPPGLYTVLEKRKNYMLANTFRALTLGILLFTATGPIPSAAAFIGASPNHPEREWKFLETPHFHIHYYQGYDSFAQLVARVAEDGFDKITGDLGGYPQEKVPIIISEDEFWNGYAEPVRNRIVLDPRLSLASAIGINRFILHEFTHIITFEAIRTGMPLSKLSNAAGLPPWFSEGIAQYEAEFWASENDRMLRLHSRNRSLLSPGERDAFVYLQGIGSEGYNEGYAIVKYWFDTYGHDKLAKLLEIYRSSNRGFADAVLATFGKTLLELEAEWRQSLEERYRAQTQNRDEKIPNSETLMPYQNRRTLFRPAYSPDGKWLAYLSSSGYPLIRGHIFSPMSLMITPLKEGKPVAEIKPKAEGSAPPLSETPYFCEHQNRAEPAQVAPNEELLQAATSVMDWVWAPDSKQIAYTHLAVNPVNGITTTHVSIMRIKTNEQGQLEKDGEPVELNFGIAHSPTWAPDGKQLALVVREKEREKIVLVDVANGKISQVLTQAPDFRQFENLAWSPDGKQLVLEAFLPGEGGNLLLLALASGKITQITESTSMYADKQPSWAPDSQSIYYVSTRDGFADVYRYTFKEHQESRISQVFTGLENPTITPDGKYLTYIMHQVKGTGMERVPVEKLTTYATAQVEPEDKLFLTENSLTPTVPKPYAPKPYQPWGIAPEFLVPVTGRDEKGDQLGVLMRFSDILERHGVLFYFLYGLYSQRISYSFAYINQFWDPSLSIQFSDFPSLSFTTDGSYFFIQRDQRIGFSLSRPLFNPGSGDSPVAKIKRTATLDYSVAFQTNLRQELASAVDERQLRQGFNNMLSFTFNENGVNTAGKDGYQYSLSLSGGAPFLGSQYQFLMSSADFRQYIPLAKDHTLAYRMSASAIRGEARPLLLGGPPLGNLLILNFQDIIPMRGFRIAEFQGDALAAGSLEYRFPILNNINLNVGGHLLNQLNGALFVDMGDAWFASKRWGYPNVSVGLELRLRAILGNRNPFQFFVGIGKPMLSQQDQSLTVYTRPLEIYGGFANIF